MCHRGNRSEERKLLSLATEQEHDATKAKERENRRRIFLDQFSNKEIERRCRHDTTFKHPTICALVPLTVVRQVSSLKPFHSGSGAWIDQLGRDRGRYKHQPSITDARVEGVERFISEPDVGDFVGTKGSLTANESLAVKFAESWHNQSSEREPRRRSRVKEILAIRETITLLNDDGAFNVFKNSSSVQVFQNTVSVVRRTMD